MKMKNMLNACAELAVAALKRQDGNVIVFLPGLQEILTTEEKVVKLMAGSLEVNTVILHSEMLGACDDQPKTFTGRTNKCNVLVLASSIAARSITLPDMRYVFIHPHTRVPVMHGTGITVLMDERVDPELEANMAGRVGRTCDGVVTYLFDIDDSEIQLQTLTIDRTVTLIAEDGRNVRTLVMACASRLHYARHTMQHLENRGFPNIMWLRTPETSDIHGLDPENNYRRRLMIIYYTTVLPAVRRLAEEEGIDGVYIIEDSCILAPNVTYAQVDKETEGCEAGIFGYAHHE
jgi:hypothetical protein